MKLQSRVEHLTKLAKSAPVRRTKVQVFICLKGFLNCWLLYRVVKLFLVVVVAGYERGGGR